MHSGDQNTKTLGEMLSDAVFALNYEEVISLVKQVKRENNSVVDARQILNRALEGANQTEVGKKDKLSKSKLAKIKIFLEKESEHIAALLVSDDVGAAASIQEVPIVEYIESELDSLSLSSEDDSFSKLERDDSAGTSLSSTLFKVISDEAETPVELTPSVITEGFETELDNRNDDNLDSAQDPYQVEQYESDDSKLGLVLKSQDDSVEYKNVKVKLTVPEELKAGGKNLLNEINEYFGDKYGRIIETLEKNTNEGSKSFSAEDLSITESSPDSSEVANKVVTDPGILGNIANLLAGVAEVTAVVATELFWPQDQVNVEPRHDEEEFTIIPDNLTFDGLIDVINKAKNYGDYAGLDKTLNNIEESDRFITDLNCGNLKDFCPQQLNSTDHMYNLLLNNSYDETSGYYNYSVKELALLAIAADDKLVEKYAETHKSILFTQDEELDKLLIGVGGQCYIKFLLEHLDKPNNTMFLDIICEKLERASFVGNQKCVEAILNRFRNTEAKGKIVFSSKLLHYAIHLAPESKVVELIVNCKVVDINSIDNEGNAPLHYAVARNNLGLISLLIKNGAEVDIKDERYGRTALHWAAYHDKFEIVKLLVNKRADWNIKDRDGKTALDLVGTKSLYLVRKENREESSNESKITKFLEGLYDKTPLRLNIKKDPESKNIDNQRSQRSVVDKEEDIINNKKVPVEETTDNTNYSGGKMHSGDQNTKTLGEMLSDAVFALNYEEVISLVKQVKRENNSVVDARQILNRALEGANQTEVGKKDKLSKSKLAKIKIFLEKESEHIAALLVSDDVGAAASIQEVPIVEYIESELDSLSLSSEDDSFSKLERDDSAGTSLSSTLFKVISDEAETPVELTPSVITEGFETELDNRNDDNLDSAEDNYYSCSSSVNNGQLTCAYSESSIFIEENTVREPVQSDTSSSQSSLLNFSDRENDGDYLEDQTLSFVDAQVPGDEEQMANEDTQVTGAAPVFVGVADLWNDTKEDIVKWPTVATLMFTVTGMLAVAAASAAYFALGTDLLVAGVAAGIGAFCIVAAIAINHYNKSPSGLLEEPDVKAVVNDVVVQPS